MAPKQLPYWPTYRPEDATVWRGRLTDDQFWLDKKNQVHVITEMETSHILNTVNMLYRNETAMAVFWVSDSSEPELAYRYLEDNWLATTPVVTAFYEELRKRGISHER